LRVSVIVVNWNRRDLLRACLNSLHSQTETAREIIVVDNGSADGSPEMVEREYPHVCLIRNTANHGFCAANNQGIQASKSEFIALLNNDAEAEAGWLQALMHAIEVRPDFGMAASKVLVWEDPGRIDKAGHLIYPDGQNRGRGSGERDHGQYDRQEETLWPDGCAALYRKGMLDAIGGFDEDFFAYADDAELGLRARIAGWRCVYTPAAVVRHHRGSTLGLRSARRLTLIERNRVLLAVKLFPLSLLCFNPLYYIARIASGAWEAAHGRGEAALYPGWKGTFTMAAALLRGDLEALSLVPRMWRKRREIDRIRKLSPGRVRELILGNRISLRELSGQSTANEHNA
jgi:GT2 family glycosyltransferase